MNKWVRIIALIMALLMGLSAIGMIAVYIAAEEYDGASAITYPSADKALSESVSRAILATDFAIFEYGI